MKTQVCIIYPDVPSLQRNRNNYHVRVKTKSKETAAQTQFKGYDKDRRAGGGKEARF